MIKHHKNHAMRSLRVIRHQARHNELIQPLDHNHEMIFPPVFDENTLVQPAIIEVDEFRYSPEKDDIKLHRFHDKPSHKHKTHHSHKHKSHHSHKHKSHHSHKTKSHHSHHRDTNNSEFVFA